MQIVVENEPDAAGPCESVLARGFMAAHLLTGSESAAEGVLMRAMDRWDMERCAEEDLAARVAEIAVRERDVETAARSMDSSAQYLPAELRAVARLPGYMRQPFVLRTLLGIPREDSARLLNVSLRQMDEDTAAAFRELAVSSLRNNG